MADQRHGSEGSLTAGVQPMLKGAFIERASRGVSGFGDAVPSAGSGLRGYQLCLTAQRQSGEGSTIRAPKPWGYGGNHLDQNWKVAAFGRMMDQRHSGTTAKESLTPASHVRRASIPMQSFTQYIHGHAYDHRASSRRIRHWAVSIGEPRPPPTRTLPPSS